MVEKGQEVTQAVVDYRGERQCDFTLLAVEAEFCIGSGLLKRRHPFKGGVFNENLKM